MGDVTSRGRSSRRRGGSCDRAVPAPSVTPLEAGRGRPGRGRDGADGESRGVFRDRRSTEPVRDESVPPITGHPVDQEGTRSARRDPKAICAPTPRSRLSLDFCTTQSQDLPAREGGRWPGSIRRSGRSSSNCPGSPGLGGARAGRRRPAGLAGGGPERAGSPPGGLGYRWTSQTPIREAGRGAGQAGCLSRLLRVLSGRWRRGAGHGLRQERAGRPHRGPAQGHRGRLEDHRRPVEVEEGVR